jgi:hypothetical protein
LANRFQRMSQRSYSQGYYHNLESKYCSKTVKSIVPDRGIVMRQYEQSSWEARTSTGSRFRDQHVSRRHDSSFIEMHSKEGRYGHRSKCRNKVDNSLESDPATSSSPKYPSSRTLNNPWTDPSSLYTHGNVKVSGSLGDIQSGSAGGHKSTSNSSGDDVSAPGQGANHIPRSNKVSHSSRAHLNHVHSKRSFRTHLTRLPSPDSTSGANDEVRSVSLKTINRNGL